VGRHQPGPGHHASTLNDNPSRVWSNRRSEVVQRLLADACELCGSTRQVEVHHVRTLKDLNPKRRKHPPEWGARMAARRAKPWLSAASAMKTSTLDVPHGNHMSTGEPDATEIGHVRFGEGPSERA
jgi:hypothetical protein